jgi:hypothetical protein
LRVQSVGLTRVNHEQNFVVSLLLEHLFEAVSNVFRGDLFVVLELQELIAAVAGHVDQNVAAAVREQTLGARYRRVVTAFKHIN